jgi:hypothetical protein
MKKLSNHIKISGVYLHKIVDSVTIFRSRFCNGGKAKNPTTPSNTIKTMSCTKLLRFHDIL